MLFTSTGKDVLTRSQRRMNGIHLRLKYLEVRSPQGDVPESEIIQAMASLGGHSTYITGAHQYPSTAARRQRLRFWTDVAEGGEIISHYLRKAIT